MGWNPIADDQYVMREFCDWADAIPYMAGNVLSEFSGNLSTGELTKNEWSAKEIDERLTAAFGDKKDEHRRRVQEGCTRTRRCRTLSFWTIASGAASKTSLARKLEKTKAPVYNYIFAYEYQVNGGVTAFHCSEIAFAFHALSEPHIRMATGGAPAALALQDKVSQAWVNFARTGNPSQPGPRLEAVHCWPGRRPWSSTRSAKSAR